MLLFGENRAWFGANDLVSGEEVGDDVFLSFDVVNVGLLPCMCPRRRFEEQAFCFPMGSIA